MPDRCDRAGRARDDRGEGAWREARRHAANQKNIDVKLGTAALVHVSDDFACVGPVIAELRGQGLSLRQIVAEADKRGIRTMRGGVWTAATVRNVLLRVAA